MRALLRATGFRAVMALLFVTGAAMLAAAAWLAPLQAADEALARGDHQRALEEGAAAEARFEALPIARRLLPRGHAASASLQVVALYRLGEHDALLEKTGRSVDHAPAHFWAGCVHFTRAADATDKQAKIAALTRARDEFRKAAALAPEDWDAKYDYELAERLLAQLREPPKTPPKQLLRLLRPEPRDGGRPLRRIG